MTATARIGGLCAGALLALGLFVSAPTAGATPHSDEPFVFDCAGDSDTATAAAADTSEPRAHPGREGTGETESGDSGTQGRSNSDPDGDENGGADKPGCGGGVDQSDQDGNNGCGNDADFEDDNNGNCGKGKKDRADDGAVVPFGAPEDEPAEEPAPAPAAVDDDPEPVVEEPVVEKPAPAIEEPAEEEVEEPIVWADPDQDTSGDPDPDEEYPSSDPAPTAADSGTDAPDMSLAAHHDLARHGGLVAAGLLVAAGALLGGGRLVGARARRRLMG